MTTALETGRATYEGTYGTLHVGAYAGEGVRIDTWVRRETGERFRERCFVAGRNDTSDRHNHDIGGDGQYDSRCACCYLGFTHSVEAHAARL